MRTLTPSNPKGGGYDEGSPEQRRRWMRHRRSATTDQTASTTMKGQAPASAARPKVADGVLSREDVPVPWPPEGHRDDVRLGQAGGQAREVAAQEPCAWLSPSIWRGSLRLDGEEPDP